MTSRLDRSMTIERYVQHVAPSLWSEGQGGFDVDRVLEWPPDAFALSAGLLTASGAYTRVLEEWPPSWSRAGSVDSWADAVRKEGRRWRRHASGERRPPDRVRHLLTRITRERSMPVAEIAESSRMAHALLELVALADEACAGAGVPTNDLGAHDAFVSMAGFRMLETNGGTLCRAIDPSHLGVLPKMRTPQSGLTLRSLTHHVALYAGLEVDPVWATAPLLRRPEEWRILLVPWPLVVDDDQFRESKAPGIQMPAGFGCFNYRPKGRPAEIEASLQRVIERATADGERIDCIVMPECALNAGQFEVAERLAKKAAAVLVAGVAVPPGRSSPRGDNQVRIRIPSEAGFPVEITQNKHHRWRFGGDQVARYGLQDSLSIKKDWWEGFELRRRTVKFVAVNARLAFCVLICEDLARLEPVASVVRSVAPNLVIALLLDGPQLGSRWPGRYATVLAEDPGSSVLTLTSLGMAARSQYKDPKTGKVYPPSRVIALWKDAKGGAPEEIEVDPGCEAVVLRVASEPQMEWSADGRNDGGAAAVPVLLGYESV